MLLPRVLCAITMFAVTSFAGVALAEIIQTDELFATGGGFKDFFVRGPGLAEPIRPFTVPPVTFNTPSPNNWAPAGTVPFAQWVTPFTSPPFPTPPPVVNCSPPCAAHAPEGSYKYSFGFNVLPQDPSRSIVGLNFLADNTVSSIQLSGSGGASDICGDQCKQARLNQLGFASIPVSNLVDPTGGRQVAAEVTVVNTNGAGFNPTGLQLVVQQLLFEGPLMQAPEPSTLSLLGIGGLSWFLYTRLTKKSLTSAA